MHEEHGFTWLTHIPGLEHVPLHILHAVLVSVILISSMFFARLQLAAVRKTEGAGLVPPSKMTYRNFFEIVAEKIYGLAVSVMGEHNTHVYFPFIGTLFVFIFTSNFLGLIPGFLPPTDNMNTTFALGIFVFLYYTMVSIKSNGLLGHLKHLAMLDVLKGPLGILAILMFPIEIFSHIIRPFSLALRLKWNMAGDHIVLGVFSSLVPYAIPVVFMMLGAFVAFVQAFVFTLLTMVYISMSTAHDH